MHKGWRENSSNANNMIEEIRKAFEEISPILKNYPRKGIFVVSHEPTPDQLEELKNNWDIQEIVRMPKDIASKWQSIPPGKESIEEEILVIKNWIDEVCTPGDVVIIQGDYGASFMLADYVRKLAFTPLYAATKREV